MANQQKRKDKLRQAAYDAVMAVVDFNDTALTQKDVEFWDAIASLIADRFPKVTHAYEAKQ